MRMDFFKYFFYYSQKMMISPYYFGPPVLIDPVFQYFFLSLEVIQLKLHIEGFGTNFVIRLLVVSPMPISEEQKTNARKRSFVCC
jgi:hypothetical protein